MTFALRGASAACYPSRPRGGGWGVRGGCLRARRREALGAAVARSRPTRPFHATPHCSSHGVMRQAGRTAGHPPPLKGRPTESVQ